MAEKNYVIGVDFGTDSVRSIIVDANNGEEISSSVFYYPRWKEGLYCDPVRNMFRQHPLDYIEGLENTIREALLKAPKNASQYVKGISVDTTGSTPVAVDNEGAPLALKKGFENNPNAMFVLWKDHTAVKEAEEINFVAKNWGGVDYTMYEGGVYSSEWFWAKILHIIREDVEVRNNAFSWVEHCDWIPALLTGNTNPLTIKRSRCAAGHKAMWHESFGKTQDGGLPEENFLIKIDPLLKGLTSRLFTKTYTSDQPAGRLSPYWAERLGLNENVIVGVGAFDAHMGAVGGEIEPYILCKIMGTSTCDILIAPIEEVGNRLIKGICGQVNGSVISGMLGMEAGQSSFGDVYAWFKKVLLWPIEKIFINNNYIDPEIKNNIFREVSDRIIPLLSEEAIKIPIGESKISAIDWLNGRRTPYANQTLKGAIVGLNLGSDAPRIFRALVEATAFGAKKIVDRFQEENINIKGVIGMGGVAKKSPFVMQTVADVLNLPIKVARSNQATALGAAMFAATVAKIHKNIQEAQKAMGNGFEKTYYPDKENAKKYLELYKKYTKIGNFIEKEMSGVELQ